MLYRIQDKHGYLGRFSLIILGIVPFIGVSGQLNHALVYLVALLVCTGFTSLFVALLAPVLRDRWLFPASLGFNVLMVLFMSFLISLYWDFFKEPFYLYLQLIAVSPLILGRTYEQARLTSAPQAFRVALQDAITFGLVLVPFALFREFISFGTISLPGLEQIVVPLLKDHGVLILGLPSGGLILTGLFMGAMNTIMARNAQKPRVAPAPRPQYRKVKQEKKVYIPRPGDKGNEIQPEQPEVVSQDFLPAPSEEPPVQEEDSFPDPVNSPEESEPIPSVADSTEEVVSIVNPEETKLTEGTQVPPEVEVPPPSQVESTIHEPESNSEGLSETLNTIFSRWQKVSGPEKKRILVIGCGTGEEVYRLAMYCQEIRTHRADFTYRIRGVDNFSSRIETALEGIYKESQIENIPLEWKKKYVLKSVHSDNPQVRMVNDIRLNIEFEVAEYTDNDIYFNKPCDLILVNQNIDYFDDPKKQSLFRNIRSNLRPKGYLFLKFPPGLDVQTFGLNKVGEKIFQP